MFRASGAARLCSPPVAGSSSGAALRSPVVARRKWEASLTDFLQERRRSRGEVLATRFNDIYVRKDFTAVDEVFPDSAYETKRWTGRPTKSGSVSAAKASAEESLRAQASQRKAEISERRMRHIRDAPATPHVAKVAVLGPPNAGKSTLMNALVTAHVSAESRRAGTTADWVKGVTSVHDTQLQLLDTPGIFVRDSAVRRGGAGVDTKSTKGFGPNMHARQLPMTLAAWDSLFCANVVALTLPVGLGFLDGRRKELVREVKKRCAMRELPVVLVMTKIDLVVSEKQQMLYRHLRADIDTMRVPFADTFEVSSNLTKGLVDLKDALASFAAPGPWEFPRSDVTDMNVSDRVSEILREAFFRVLPHEIPHVTSHKIVGWTVADDKSGNKVTKVVVEVFFDRPAFMRTFFAKQLEVAQVAREQTKVVLKQNVWFHFQAFMSPCGKNRV